LIGVELMLKNNKNELIAN